MITFFLVLGIIIGICGVIQPRLRNLCGGIAFLTLYLAIAFNNGNVDYNAYVRNYDSGVFEHEGLFSFLELISKNFGLSYAQFVFFIVTISFLLIWITIKKLNINTAAFCILYFFYPFCLDVIQIRNLLAYSIIFYAFLWLIEGDRKGKIKYAIAVLIASTIHFSSIVYLSILLYEFIKNSKKIRIAYATLTAVFIISTLNVGVLRNYLTIFQTYVYKYTSDTRVFEMAICDVGERGYIIFYAIHFTLIALQLICLNDINKQEENVLNFTKGIVVDTTTAKRYIELVFWMGIVLTIFIPLYRFQATLFRITRNLMLMNYSGLLVYCRSSIKKNKSLILSVLLVAIVAFMFWFEIYRGINKDLIFDAIFENNWLN